MRAQHDYGDILLVGDAQYRRDRIAPGCERSRAEARLCCELTTLAGLALGELGGDLVPIPIDAAQPSDEVTQWVKRELIGCRYRDRQHDCLVPGKKRTGAMDSRGCLLRSVEAQQRRTAHDAASPVVKLLTRTEKPQRASATTVSALATTEVAIMPASGLVSSKNRRVAGINSVAT